MSYRISDIFVSKHLIERNRSRSSIWFSMAVAIGAFFSGSISAYANNPVDLDRGRLLVCRSGADKCLDKIVRQMTKNYRHLGCDHNSAFALLYLRTTESVRDAARLGEFRDRQWANTITPTFGRYYLDAYELWKRGHNDGVPEAWRIAFDAAKHKSVSTLGDIYLGINAHVNRDLAFAQYRVGMFSDDGTSRYADYNHINTVLIRARQISFPEIIATLDSSVETTPLPSGIDLNIFAWREVAWRNAERLAAAPNHKARRLIAAEIEENAANMARAIAAAFPADDSFNQFRDAYCAAHR